MPRAGTAMLAAGAAVVLGSLVMLRALVRAQSLAPPAAPRDTSASVAPPSPPQPGVPAAAASPRPIAAPGAVAAARSTPAPPRISAPAAPSLPPALSLLAMWKPRKKRKPIATSKALRAQITALQPRVVACARTSRDDGYAPDGTVDIVYVVAPHPDARAVVVETSDTDYDTTTIKDQPLLDCLTVTAKAMTFPFVADTDAVVVTERIVFKGGTLASNTLNAWHYIR